MSRTIEAITAHIAPGKRGGTPRNLSSLTVTWQDGLAMGPHAQHKLRFGLTNLPPVHFVR